MRPCCSRGHMTCSCLADHGAPGHGNSHPSPQNAYPGAVSNRRLLCGLTAPICFQISCAHFLLVKPCWCHMTQQGWCGGRKEGGSGQQDGRTDGRAAVGEEELRDRTLGTAARQRWDAGITRGTHTVSCDTSRGRVLCSRTLVNFSGMLKSLVGGLGVWVKQGLQFTDRCMFKWVYIYIFCLFIKLWHAQAVVYRYRKQHWLGSHVMIGCIPSAVFSLSLAKVHMVRGRFVSPPPQGKCYIVHWHATCSQALPYP